MPWFWGSSKKEEDDEDDSEYDSDEYEDDEEDSEEEDSEEESELEDEESDDHDDDGSSDDDSDEASEEDESLEESDDDDQELDENERDVQKEITDQEESAIISEEDGEKDEPEVVADDENPKHEEEEHAEQSDPQRTEKDPDLGKFIVSEDSVTERTASPETSSEETTPLNNHNVNVAEQDEVRAPAPETMDMPTLQDKDSSSEPDMAEAEEGVQPTVEEGEKEEEQHIQQSDNDEIDLVDVAVDDNDEGEMGELVLQGAIPGEVVGNRDRAPSALTHEDEENISQDTLDSEDLEDFTDEEEEEITDDEEEEDDENATTLEEKQSLLILAAQYDRVDILNTVLSEATNAGANDNNADQDGDDTKEIKSSLLHGGLPPLHVAILSGSINAINCLLRVGADPSVRPDLAQISAEQIKSVKNAKLLDGVTAWELAFGNEEHAANRSKLNLPLSKMEGIQHAFSAEALRCIGSDEVDRLEQLLKSGVPPHLSMGDKELLQWAVDMKALNCQRLLRPEDDSAPDSTEEPVPETVDTLPNKTETSALVDRPPAGESVDTLVNRLDELESLARALSTCLDNLAEEVSVCNGLLLMGGGASALAAHVRSLKVSKEAKTDELTLLLETYENTEDELAYWVLEAGEEGKKIAEQMTVIPNSEESAKKRFLGEDQDEESQRRQLTAQVAASETKIHKLRVSITELSEENAKDLQEVERRGLSGGIQLVRGLKDEIRELEFQISEARSADAACRVKISMIQAKVAAEKKRIKAAQSTDREEIENPEPADSSSPSADSKNGPAPTKEPSQFEGELPQPAPINEEQQVEAESHPEGTVNDEQQVEAEPPSAASVNDEQQFEAAPPAPQPEVEADDDAVASRDPVETGTDDKPTEMQAVEEEPPITSREIDVPEQMEEPQMLPPEPTEEAAAAVESDVIVDDVPAAESIETEDQIVALPTEGEKTSEESTTAVDSTQRDIIVGNVKETENSEGDNQIVVLATTDGETKGAEVEPKASGTESATDSQRITEGQSTAIAVRGEGDRAYFTLGLWNILLRIIGVQKDQKMTVAARNRHSQPVVII